ncbi:MAG: DNA repair protein RadC [Pseudomonadota bacterium]
MNQTDGPAGHRSRLRKRYLKNGAEGLHLYEILELLLTYAIPRQDVKPLAKRLLREFRSFRGVLDATTQDLAGIPGLGEQSILLIKLVRDCSDLYLKHEILERAAISSPGELIDYCRSAMAGLKNEQFRCIFLNTKNRLLADEIVEEGTISQTVVYPRKVIERAIFHKATALIFVHNHPSGDVNPSRQDIALTETLKNAAGLIGVTVHDHLIIGESGHYSFRENGLI